MRETASKVLKTTKNQKMGTYSTHIYDDNCSLLCLLVCFIEEAISLLLLWRYWREEATNSTSIYIHIYTININVQLYISFALVEDDNFKFYFKIYFTLQSVLHN